MELWQLNYFINVVEEGSISAAARKLHVSQPPLSLQIKRLEEELGTPLFFRNGRTMTLTDAGAALYHRAQAICDLTAITAREVRAIAEGGRGILRLGITSSSDCAKVREKILAFHRQNHGLAFEFYEANSHLLIDMLRKGQLDAAFVRTPFPKQDFLCASMEPEPLVAVGPADFFPPAPTSSSVSIGWLAAQPLILYRRWEGIIRHAFDENGVSLSPLCLTDDARTCLSFALSGFGIALVPRSTIDPAPDAQALIHTVDGLDILSSITLIVPKDERAKAAQSFFQAFCGPGGC